MSRPRLLSSNQIRERFGGISDMTLWRWLRDPALGFPQPLTIQRRRYWPENEVEEFEERRANERVTPAECAAGGES